MKKTKIILTFILNLSILISSVLTRIPISNSFKDNYVEYDNELSEEQILKEALEIGNFYLEEYIDYEKYNENLKLSFKNIDYNDDELLLITINKVYNDLGHEDKKILEKLSNEDDEIKKFVELMKNELGIYDSQIKVNYFLSQLTKILNVAGLSYSAIAIIKGAFLTMLTTLKLFFTPLIIKISIVVAAIIAISAVVIYNWESISPYFKELTNIFINSAGRLKSAVETIILQIGRKANENHDNFELLYIYQEPLEDNRVYQIAYILTGKLEKGEKMLGFIEAYAVLLAMGLVEKVENSRFVNFKLNNELRRYVLELSKKGIIKKRSGIYTKFQADAEKLAYAFGGYYKDGKKLKNEIHDKRYQSGYYQHYHPFSFKHTHIWYGEPR